MADLRQNTWQLDEWYAQAVAGNAEYNGAGEMWMFGRNNEYQLTDYPPFLPGTPPGNPYKWFSSPVQLPSASGTWTDGGNNPGGSTCAFGVKADGSVWVWGEAGPVNSLGLSQPNTTLVSSPKQLMSAPSGGYKTRVVMGEEAQQIAVTNNGEMYIWGNGNYGQLGLNDGGSQNDYKKRSSPTQLPGTWSMNFITDGMSVLATKTDGTLWSWGRSTAGQLGLNQGNPNIKISSPTQVGTDTTWSTTKHHLFTRIGAVGCTKTDGTLWVWGWNGDAGVLGLSQSGGQTTKSRSSPTQLPGTTWGTYGTSTSVAMSVKTDGSLWTWGDNQYGRLGLNQSGNHNNPNQSFSSPKQVGTNTNWVTAYTTGASSWATKSDGTLWVWGQNNPAARLGLNDQSHRSSPTQIPGTWDQKKNQMLGGYRAMLFKTL